MGSRQASAETNSGSEVMPTTESKAFSRALASDSVEIILDIADDMVTKHSIQATGGGGHEDPKLALPAKKSLEGKKTASSRSLLLRNTSAYIRDVSKELKSLASFSKRKSAAGRHVDQSRSSTVHALKNLNFISAKVSGAKGWASVEKRFDNLTVNSDGLLNYSLFGECIGDVGMNKESKEFASELFRAIARRRNITGDAINKHELREFWEQISDQRFDSRLKTFFDMVDKDADGRITEEEVRYIISLSASANKLSNIQEQAQEYAAVIMEELDPDKVGYIRVEDLETLLLHAPVNPSATGSDGRVLSELLSQKLKPPEKNNRISRCYQKNKYFLLDNFKRVWVLMLWIGIVSALFVYKFVQYKNKEAFEVMGYCVCIAKGGAETLKFNMALILLPVCRNTITWLRNKTKLGVVVPFDNNMGFHKIIAVGIAIGVGLLAGAHLTCDFPRLIHASEEQYETMIPYFGKDQPENYWWFLKGVEGLTGIGIVVLMAIAFPLATHWFRSKINSPKPEKKLVTGFNTFWYSHHLFVIVYALLIVHGIKLYLTKKWYYKTTWMYLAVPVFLYACERLIRFFRSSIKPVKILKVAVYPGDVLALQMSKPQGFKYKSGQYMFVKCAAVSPFEWHPFSITSSPGDDYLSVHIRALGDWTGTIKDLFSSVCQPSVSKSGILRAEMQEENNPSFPTIVVDGPYGAPAQDYKNYDVVLLIGLGIGATPMVSIVKDIINNTNFLKNKELDEYAVLDDVQENGRGGNYIMNNRSSGESDKLEFRTQKAYYYWVTKEQRSFEWFKSIINEVAEMDKNGVIELHNYCTSVYEEGDARSALIAMIQDIHHAKKGIDVVTGTKFKSHFARPT